MSKLGAWVLLFALGIVLIDVGFQGHLGSLLGAVLTPSQLQDSQGATNGG